MKYPLTLLFACTMLFSLRAQEETATEKLSREANRLFKAENYTAALPMYLNLLKVDSTDVNYIYRTGICYLKSNVAKGEAAPYFAKLVKKTPNDADIYLQAGSAFQFAYEFDTALTYYLFYLKEMEQSQENTEAVRRKIESCENARELMKFPRDVTFENLGKNVNTEFPDYYPFIPLDESFILYNSRRNMPGHAASANGLFPSDVFISYVRDGHFQPARPLSKKLNSASGDEDVVGLSGKSKMALFYLHNEEISGDIYIGHIRGDQVDSLTLLPSAINSPISVESAASLSADGQTIYFTSNRPGGFGGYDLYATRMLPTGKWSDPQNLGETVNTPYDEDFPNISHDDKILYFSSKGHTSMGGYDIFTASREHENDPWTNIRNMGVPINTPDDDMNFRVSANGRYGYISSVRNDGMGDRDIYRITFHEVDPEFTVLKGNIYNTSMQRVNGEVFISVDVLKTSERYGDYLPNPVTGRYIIILPPGKYVMHATAEDGSSFREQLEIYDKSSFVPEIDKNIMLKK